MTRPARFTVQVCKRRCIPTNVPFSIKVIVVGPASTIAQPSNLQGWAQRVQCDEIWSFCYAKEENVPVEKQGTGAGSVWTWTAIDTDSKLIISYLCGGRDASWACQFMEDLASRVTRAFRSQRTVTALMRKLSRVPSEWTWITRC